MAATKNANRDFDVQLLTDVVQGEFAGKTAFMGSPIVSQGGCEVSGEMPHGRNEVGNEVTFPYFGTLGEFDLVNEDVGLVPKTMDTTNEKTTVAHAGLAFEVTTWAQHPGRADLDPYQESARQAQIQATRFIDKTVVAKASTTPLIADYYSASSPKYLDYDMVVDAKSLWGDAQNDIIAMVIHSRTHADLLKMRDNVGRPLLQDSLTNSAVGRIAGIPLIISDMLSSTGSAMTTPMAETASITDIAVTGTPLGPWKLVVKCTATGSETTAKFKFSVDGGNIWSAELTAAASLALIDTAKDSLVGMNGKTGLTLTLSGTYTASDTNYWTSTASFKTTSLIVQKGAMGFWFNRNLLSVQKDKDILKDNDIAALHMYHACHLYRRRVNGVLPGVIAVKHNVRGYTG